MPIRTPRNVITQAKAYVADVFGDEGAYNIGLEEIMFNGDSNSWEVTIGFSRPWDRPTMQNALIPQGERRTYKVVDINDFTGNVLGVRNRPSNSALGA